MRCRTMQAMLRTEGRRGRMRRGRDEARLAWRSPRIFDWQGSEPESDYRSRRECLLNFRLTAFNSTRARTMDAAAGIERRPSAAHAPSMLNGDRDGKMQGMQRRRGQINRAQTKNAASVSGSGVFIFEHRKRRISCPWQAWQRPTLP